MQERVGKYILILFLFLSLQGRAAPAPLFHNVSMPREMNVSRVWCIERDSSGMIWLGTNCGAFSYDGYAMRYHSRRVPGRNIYCLKDVPGDALYMGEDRGLLAYDPVAAECRQIPTSRTKTIDSYENPI